MSDVYVASSGWLFLLGGNNDVRQIYSGLHETSWIEAWVKLIAERKSYFERKKIKYCHVSAPEKVAVYSRYLDEEVLEEIKLNCAPSRLLEKAIKNKGVQDSYVNPVDFLRKQSEKYKVYHQTDSHWTFLGAFSVYQLLMSKLGLEIDSAILANQGQNVKSIMDLGGKMTPKVQEEVFFYKLRPYVKRIYRNRLVEYKEDLNIKGLHVGSSVEFLNTKALHDCKVLIFGDSFSEYRPHLLTGLLAETFKNVKFVWSVNVDKQIVECFKPDIVISEAAERFMPLRIPKDDFNCSEFVEKAILAHQVKDA